MEVILIIVLIFCFVRGQAYKTSIRALKIYLERKGYNLPTDNELKECSRIALGQIFKK